MDDILKVVLDFVLRDLLLSPGEREKKRLMKLAKRGNSPFGDRVVCMLYVLGYGVLLFGSIWGGRCRFRIPGIHSVGLWSFLFVGYAGAGKSASADSFVQVNGTVLRKYGSV